MKEFRLPSVEPFTAVLLDVLNLVFGWGFETVVFVWSCVLSLFFKSADSS